MFYSHADVIVLFILTLTISCPRHSSLLRVALHSQQATHRVDILLKPLGVRTDSGHCLSYAWPVGWHMSTWNHTASSGDDGFTGLSGVWRLCLALVSSLFPFWLLIFCIVIQFLVKFWGAKKRMMKK